MIAIIKDHYEYVLTDIFGTIYGYFETEGLAHQYLQKEYPSPTTNYGGGQKQIRKYSDRILNKPMEIKRIKKESIAIVEETA